MSTPPPPTPPETRDWTFVIERGCPECGYAPHDPVTTKSRLTAANGRWRNALLQPDVHERPSPEVWSPIEYACHARDMIRLLRKRAAAMLDSEDPTFADWDGDAAAVTRSYWAADPRGVSADQTTCAQRTLNVLARIPPPTPPRGPGPGTAATASGSPSRACASTWCTTSSTTCTTSTGEGRHRSLVG